MSAFNSRLNPKEIFGVPVWGALGLIAALVFGVLGMMLPSPFGFILEPLALLGIAVSAVSFVMGDELPWVDVKLMARAEAGCITSEIDKEEN